MRILISGTGALPREAMDIIKREHKTNTVHKSCIQFESLSSKKCIYDAAIFVSKTINGQELDCAEADLFIRFCEWCNNAGINKIIYIALNMQMFGFTGDVHMLIEKSIKKHTYCAVYIPFIYDCTEACFPLNNCMHMFASGAPVFSNGEKDRIAFIASKDLGVLLLRMLDATATGIYYASGAYTANMHSFSILLKSKFNIRDVRFNEKSAPKLPIIEPVSMNPAKASFGIFETHSLENDIDEAYKAFYSSAENAKHTLYGKIKSMVKLLIKPSLLQTLGITALFIIVEAVIVYTQSRGDLSFSDFRLLFSCIGGAVYGLTGGGYAAFLACAAYLASRLFNGVSAAVMFYNPENWLPFVFYVAAGCCLGYTHDRHMARISQLEAKLANEREKYQFLESVYTDTSKEAAQLKQRLIGSHESLGRIYSLVNELDKSMPEEVISELITVASKTLENDSCAIYCIGDERYARLMACTPSLESKLAKSLDTRRYNDVLAELKTAGIWKNTALDKHMPMYCALICSRQRQYVLFLYNAEFEQMNTYYENEIKVLCGLARQSFVHAAEYFEADFDKRFLPNTQLFKATYFKQQLSLKQKMQKQNKADFLLCRIYKSGLAYGYLSARISAIMRIYDIAGCLDDGNIYIIFTQMRQGDFPIVEKRFAAAGICLIKAETEVVA